MNPRNFDGSRLSLWDKDQLIEAEALIDPLAVKHLDICAKCYQSMPLESLLKRISRYSNIVELHLADDFISDVEMGGVKVKFLEAFGQLTLKWTHDLLVNGKHGR